MTTPQSPENLTALFRQRLFEESQRWTEENLLSPEQRDAILRRYEKLPEAGKEVPRFIQTILALGIFLVGLAVLLLISFNWAYLTGTIKLTIVGTALAAAHISGFTMRKAGWKNWADGDFFLAGILYGVGIWQIGQVLHMPADTPMLFWLWALGTFPLALVLVSTPLHLLSIACLAAWVIADQVGTLSPRSWILYGEVALTAWSLPIFAVIGIVAGVLKHKKSIATLYVLLFLFWWFMQGIACGLDAYLTFHIVAIGLICFVLSSWRFENLRNTDLERIGFLLVFGGLIPPSFLWFWDGLFDGKMSIHDWFDSCWRFTLPVMNVLILLGLFRWINRTKSIAVLIRHNKMAVAWITSFFVLWLGTSYYAVLNPNSHFCYDVLSFDLASSGMLAVNVLFVWLATGLMLGGLKRGRGTWFWYGTVFFMLWAMLRYVDLFSDLGMLGTAAVFLFCGLFMLGIVYFWTNYRHKFRSEEPVAESPSTAAMPIWWTTLSNRILLLWQSERNMLTAAVIVAAAQFAVLGAMIGNEMVPHISGTTIRVATVPVDPRDLFRGDYVVLDYEFSSVGSIQGGASIGTTNVGQTVYVSMEQEGELWKAIGVSQTKPKEGVFLRGTFNRNGRIEYGIESYYVQEGKGKPIEEAMRTWRRNRGEGAKSVIVELVIAANGKAAIKAVHV